ncbi:substrate-binding domain-containing protein [Aliiroseovarius subalbicans]|uniref:substrate-binding domain-containing protein n=1 Tax=Aliiroseovarius subalbicans TaxID=2925840 RepID=UPI001F57ACA2|nr:substrate-binding domain-containing protein [Aliiroseovarius subalbicans]MCI2399927.1 substrate-binding domain-containing protein [Aliiroseovarius subalbicans]
MTRLFAALITLLIGMPAIAGDLKLAVTTSFHNSGLSNILLPVIKADIGLNVHLIVVGTGQAIRLGEAGDVDAILVHSRTAEEAFLAQGFGRHRREIMYNDFVLIGPADDPAGIAAAPDAIAALTAIAETRAPFVSRGDDSGTHKKELALWVAAGIADRDVAWYREAGSGMGATLNTAAALGSYVLADRASWLNFGNPRGIALLFTGDPVLFNQYAFLPVNQERHPHVKSDLNALLEAWLVSEKAQTMIAAYQINGETLFTANAVE